MAIVEIFSKRNKKPADVLTYDNLPAPLRRQIVFIWVAALGNGQSEMYSVSFSETWWNDIVRTLSKELGVFGLGDRHTRSFDAAVDWFMQPHRDIKNLLDLVQLAFQHIDVTVREQWNYSDRYTSFLTQTPDDAIIELNHRFLEHGVGYQFEGGRIVSVESTYTHAEVIKPALSILANPRFKNAQTEFLLAHEAYRAGRYSDCLNESLKALESTLKIICTARKWRFDANRATASTLIDIVLANGLVHPSLQTQFTSLKSLLESGTPTIRNKMSGHGMGANAVKVPDYLAAYGLQTCAANISLLGAAFAAKP